MVKVDSPVSRRIVHSFLDFLKSVEPAPGVDLEGLEVVRECLEDVFKLNPSSVDEQTQPGLLLKYFSSLDSNKQHESRSGQAVTFQNATGDAQASPSHTANQQESKSSGKDASPVAASAGPVTEDEIRAVLLQKSPVTTQDLVAKFRARLKSSKDKSAFAEILKKIAKIQKTSGAGFVVLRDK